MPLTFGLLIHVFVSTGSCVYTGIYGTVNTNIFDQYASSSFFETSLAVPGRVPQQTCVLLLENCKSTRICGGSGKRYRPIYSTTTCDVSKLCLIRKSKSQYEVRKIRRCKKKGSVYDMKRRKCRKYRVGEKIKHYRNSTIYHICCTI